MHRRSFVALVAAAPALIPLAGRAQQSAQEILAASDRVRNPGTPFSLTNVLTEYRGGKPGDRMVLQVYSKEDTGSGKFRSLVRFVEPPRDENKLILQDGLIMWFYDPAAKSSIRLSPQQRLMGQASNGDVVTVNFARDYQASLSGEETIADADRQNHNCWRLDMTAASEGVTYARVEYWIAKATSRPIKGKFYSDSGRLLKTAYYRRYQEVMGGQRPTETLIIDGVDTQLVTRMLYSDFAPRDIPESWYQRDYLPRFRPE